MNNVQKILAVVAVLLLILVLSGCSVEYNVEDGAVKDITVKNADGEECSGLLIQHDVTLWGSNAKGDEHIGLACGKEAVA